MSDKTLRKELIRLAHSNKELRPHLLPIITAGCEKLPEGPMRDNCEKSKEDGAVGGKGKAKKDKGKKDDGKMPPELLEKFKAKDKKAAGGKWVVVGVKGDYATVISKPVDERRAKELLKVLSQMPGEKNKAMSIEDVKAQFGNKIVGKEYLKSGSLSKKAAGKPKSISDLPSKEQSVAKKMKAKGYSVIVQVTANGKNFGEPLYFKGADKVGPFLRSFPDSAKAKTAWNFSL